MSRTGTQVEYQLFDALTSYDAEKGEIVPLACESFEANDDATEFTFKIKKAKFHNGDDVTSKSFKLGWERLVNTKSAIATEYGPSEVSYHLSMVEGYDDLLAGNATELSGVTCPDDETLVVKLSSAYADFPFVASHPALAPVPECAESDAKSFYLAPVGNGPFMMDGKWEDGQEINLKKFDDYYGDKAKIDGIHFRVIKDMETAYKEFGPVTSTSATFPLLRSTPPRRIAACPRTATPWATASACCSAPSLPPTT